jgi:hypothetical protein
VHAVNLSLETHTHGICNTYYFSTATVVARTRRNVTLFVHYLSYCDFVLHIGLETCLSCFVNVLMSSISCVKQGVIMCLNFKCKLVCISSNLCISSNFYASRLN